MSEEISKKAPEFSTGISNTEILIGGIHDALIEHIRETVQRTGSVDINQAVHDIVERKVGPGRETKDLKEALKRDLLQRTQQTFAARLGDATQKAAENPTDSGKIAEKYGIEQLRRMIKMPGVDPVSIQSVDVYGHLDSACLKAKSLVGDNVKKGDILVPSYRGNPAIIRLADGTQGAHVRIFEIGMEKKGRVSRMKLTEWLRKVCGFSNDGIFVFIYGFRHFKIL